MTWNGKNPLVTFTEKLYETGKKVEKEVMKLYEAAIERAGHEGVGEIVDSSVLSARFMERS